MAGDVLQGHLFCCDYEGLLDVMPPTWLAAGRPFPGTNCYLHGCQCGFYGDTTRECRCTPGMIQRYLGKISGPLLDRIDIHLEVPAVPYKEMRATDTSESSADIRAVVGIIAGILISMVT